MIFQVTERGVFRRCRWKWQFSSENQMNLQPLIDAPSLTLGLIIHKALEQWFDHPDMQLEELFMANAALALRRIRDKYKAAVGADISAVELADVKGKIATGIGMMKNYQTFYGSPVPDGFNLIATEQQAVLKVPGTIHKLGGRLDALIQRKSDGAIFVVDHKTYSKKSSTHEIDNNDQFLAYVWVAGKALNLKVAGVFYNGLYVKDSPPKYGSLEDLFFRHISERSDYEVKQFEKMLARELDEMANKNLPMYPNRRWEGCWDCKSFDVLCEARMKNPAGYALRLKHNFTQRDRNSEEAWELDE